MKLRGRWRSRHPLRFFLLGQLAAVVVLVVGSVIAGEAAKHVPAAQPGDGIGVSIASIGFLLMVTLFVIGIVDLGVTYAAGSRPPTYPGSLTRNPARSGSSLPMSTALGASGGRHAILFRRIAKSQS